MISCKRMYKILSIAVVCTVTTAWSSDRVAQLLALLENRPDILIEALFVPTDKPQSLLLELIKQEKEAIWIALYNLTDPEVAQELLAAHERGVDIQLIADVEALRPKAEQVTMLYDNDVPVWLYAEYRSLMHNKYLLFADTVGDAPLVWTGSANVTKVGFKGNQENVVLLNDEETLERYLQDFERIKQRIRHAPSKKLVLRNGCHYEGRNLVVKLKRALRRFRV